MNVPNHERTFPIVNTDNTSIATVCGNPRSTSPDPGYHALLWNDGIGGKILHLQGHAITYSHFCDTASLGEDLIHQRTGDQPLVTLIVDPASLPDPEHWDNAALFVPPSELARYAHA